MITAYVRQQTELINEQATSYLSEYYTSHWSTTVDIVLHRVHSNPNIGMRENFSVGKYSLELIRELNVFFSSNFCFTRKYQALIAQLGERQTEDLKVL